MINYNSFDRELDALERELDSGVIDQAEYTAEMRAIGREMAEAEREEEEDNQRMWERVYNY